MNKITHFRCWAPDNEGRDHGETYERWPACHDPQEAAEAYALLCYEGGDPFHEIDITVESLDAAGNVLATESFTAEADYDVSFYAYKNDV